jgi:hypothetical protein
VQAREKRKGDVKKGPSSPSVNDLSLETERHAAKAPLSNSILPIPIRADTTVFVQGLPFDLTEAEAAKIANVIRAMATPA